MPYSDPGSGPSDHVSDDLIVDDREVVKVWKYNVSTFPWLCRVSPYSERNVATRIFIKTSRFASIVTYLQKMSVIASLARAEELNLFVQMLSHPSVHQQERRT